MKPQHELDNHANNLNQTTEQYYKCRDLPVPSPQERAHVKPANAPKPEAPRPKAK